MQINKSISTYGRADQWELARSLPINFVHNGNEYRVIRFHTDINLEYDSNTMMLVPECSTEMTVYLMDLKQKMIYEIDLEDVEIIKEVNNSFSNYWLITMRLNVKNALQLREKILKDSFFNNLIF